ncbi:MAG TPA: hypothetical protein VGO00_28245, partial [Kofleriaceae bacterium]|nr:hypothetical protein [Kofleriaceae bacterium]
MAIFTFLLSFIARKANDIVQAVFGWSITALFGRLRRRQQILVTSALVLSLAWPLFVLGTVAPAVASWAVAMVPFHHWLGDNGIRIVWISLAVLAPLGVGLLVHLAVPTSHASVVTSLVHGYPIATGFFLAFVVIVVTVPILKIASLVRRWSDEHVFVQPHDNAYDAVLDCLVEACKRAGLTPAVSDAPRAMVLATTIMRTLAASAVSPFVAKKLRRVTADGIEMYLYPGDLLLRGKTFQVSKV